MVKYTRRHYVDIGNLIKKLPKSKRKAEASKWDKIFKKDNPLYDSKRFKRYVGVISNGKKKKGKKKKR